MIRFLLPATEAGSLAWLISVLSLFQGRCVPGAPPSSCAVRDRRSIVAPRRTAPLPGRDQAAGVWRPQVRPAERGHKDEYRDT